MLILVKVTVATYIWIKKCEHNFIANHILMLDLSQRSWTANTSTRRSRVGEFIARCTTFAGYCSATTTRNGWYVEGKLNNTTNKNIIVKAEIRSLESQLSMTDNAALVQYLRNVLIQYFRCDNATGRKHMLKAIAQVLKFSNSDLQAINAASVWDF